MRFASARASRWTASRRRSGGSADSGIARLAEATLAGNELMVVATVALWPDSGPAPLGTGRDVGRMPPTAAGEAPPAARALVIAALQPVYARLAAGPRDGESLGAMHSEILATFESFRVLAAHRRGPLGVEGLNQTIETWLEEEGWITPGDPTYLGRPILVLRNDPGSGRFNGDVGLVVRGADGQRVVAFPGDEADVTYLAPVRLPEHETAFALTIHKSQGSEFDDVLLVLPARASPILTRELLYTGATRARRRLTVLAHAEVLAAAVRRPVQRASGLAGRLLEGFAAPKPPIAGS